MKKLAQTSTCSSSRLQEMVMVVEVKAEVKKTMTQTSAHCSFGLHEIVRDMEVKARMKRQPR